MGKCHQCGVRWIQHHGLCRQCAQLLGVDTRNTIERERDRLAAGPTPVRMQKAPPEPERIVTVDGVDYVVKWDGT